MQIKTTMGYHLTLVRMVIIKKPKILKLKKKKSLQISNAGEGAEKKEPSHTVDGNVNWCGHYEEWYVCA